MLEVNLRAFLMETNVKSKLFKKFNWPNIALAILMLGLIMLGSTHPAYADGTFISAPNRVDMVHDPNRNILYITSGGEVLRFSLATRSFLSSFQLGGSLMGMDLSPDANTLAVADKAYSNDAMWIYLVNLQSGAIQKVTIGRGPYDGGTYSVAFGNDGNILITTRFLGSGWVTLRMYNPTTGTMTAPESVRQDTMLTSSADGSVIGFAESNNSDGPWGRYRVSDGNFVRRRWGDGTGWFNYEIGTNRNGTQFAIPTYGGTFVYDSNFAKIATVGQYASPQPIGVVYDPTRDIVYFAWAETTEVRAFETATFTQVAAFNFEFTFQNTAFNRAFTQGRLKMSRDGSSLFATVGGGIRYVKVAGPFISITSPQAKDYLHTATFNVTWRVTDSGSGIASQSGTLDIVPVTNGQTIDLFFLSLGPHTVTVRATDLSGNSSTASVTFNVVSNIDSLIAEKERVCSLGWIKDPNVCKSLDAKLREAKDAIQRGQINTAKSKLNDFISELNAQLGKAVNQQAYDLLKADALYVINHLP